MSKKRAFTCAVLILIHLSVAAGADEPNLRSNELRASPPGIAGTKSRLELSTFFEAPTHSFLISTDAGRVDSKVVGQRVQYNPTFGPNIGVRASYELWSLSYSRRLSFVEGADVGKYGKTEFDDWRLGLNISKNLLIEAYYQNYHGFYTDLNGREGLQTEVRTESHAAAPVTAQESVIISRPDIRSLNYGLRTTYILPLMDFARALASDEEKANLNWDFNFLAKAYYNRLSITGDRPLVPEAHQGAFSPIAALREYWTHTAGVGIGLGVILPMGTPTLTLGFSGLLGGGVQRRTVVFSDREAGAFSTGQELNFDVYLNWTGDNHAFRTGVYIDHFTSRLDDVNFDTSSLGLNMIYTYRGIAF